MPVPISEWLGGRGGGGEGLTVRMSVRAREVAWMVSMLLMDILRTKGFTSDASDLGDEYG